MTEKEYEYILNPKTGKLVKTCGNIGMKLIKNYEYEEIYNPETKRTVNFNKTTGKKVYKKYGKYIEKYSKKGGAAALAALAATPVAGIPPRNIIQPSTKSCPRLIKFNQCIKSNPNQCTLITFRNQSRLHQDFCRFGLNSSLYKHVHNHDKFGSNTNMYLNENLNVNNNLYLVMYSDSHGKTNYIVSSTLNTTLNTTKNLIEVVQQTTFLVDNSQNPPNPPISTSTYQFDCEPSNAKQVCNSSMQTNETLKKFLQILAAYIDTLVMLLYPQLTNIFTVEWLKNVLIEYIFNQILNLVIPTQIDNKGLLVNILVRNMMGDNFITISAKLTLKTFASGYTENLPQVIIKKEVITLLDYVKKLKSERQPELNTEEMPKVLEEITKVLEENTTENTKIQTLTSDVKQIVKKISVNFDITVKEEEVKNS